MNASDKVLVDTSAWIDYFRLVEPCHSIVARLLAEGKVCSIGLILAELMQGAKSEKELNVLRDFIHVFSFLPDSPETWQAAGELSFNLRRSGKTIGLSDCFIAVVAQSGDACILSNDMHFEMIRPFAEIRLFEK